MSKSYTNVDDEKLWETFVRESDEVAFEILYKRYYVQLVRFSWRYSKSKAVSEELVQDFFAEIWENADLLNLTNSIRAYFYKAIRNSSLNYLKHKKVREKYDPEWMSMKKETVMPEIEDKFREEKIREAIKEAVESLPERSRMTYKLHRYDGLTYEEIAEVMGVSVKTVESQMTRSLKILRSQLSYLLPLLLIIVA
ncbi:RNA polymerase sigma-70 factor [Rhodohalobacter sulfatireducens]|uniref:RNA polymerase sigma-70 factor n=1 Tax=Rhodohalobacter sulfatireducens TaxID=2911366 RepID=A0ABS9K9R8_9BACT|nr:RNA polymerase sigma-70 factor [Rhodohalobacter sulfatireducens]MCG2587595.1 RNA polymerase sigma-70 factor [Rhodohalobacter sulfatireducens]